MIVMEKERLLAIKALNSSSKFATRLCIRHDTIKVFTSDIEYILCLKVESKREDFIVLNPYVTNYICRLMYC